MRERYEKALSSFAENETVCRTGEPVSITPRSRKTVEEAAYVYTKEYINDKGYY
ncbi:MAG: hypothetical protein LBH16_04025 [Treponema sp.]|nr:hypothetical protein [Treponema sp.]